MTTKLTPAQRSILQHLHDGDSIFRSWHKTHGQWTVTGPWGTVGVSGAAVDILLSKGLVITGQQDVWLYARLTARGRALLASSVETDGER